MSTVHLGIIHQVGYYIKVNEFNPYHQLLSTINLIINDAVMRATVQAAGDQSADSVQSVVNY